MSETNKTEDSANEKPKVANDEAGEKPSTSSAGENEKALLTDKIAELDIQNSETYKKLQDLQMKLEMVKLSNNPPKSELEAKRKKFEFWDTQPVPKLSETIQTNEPIEPDKPVEQIQKEGFNLPPGFLWVSLDLDSEDHLKELYTLLYENYVEDDDNMFRFNYSPQFLHWVLKSPGWQPDWYVGLRVEPKNANSTGKLVGFISAIPTKIRIYDKVIKSVEINFLCVHKKLRSKRMTPVLISEITRRVNLHAIYQAVYTAGIFLPKPISICRYFHRSLNPKKLIDVGFSSLSRNMTMSRTIKYYRLPEQPLQQGLRQFVPKDIGQVYALLTAYMNNFDLVPHYSQEELLHWLTPVQDVVDCYVIERVVEKKKKIIAFFSFYMLPSTVMNHKTYKDVKAAYAFYNVPSQEVAIIDLMQDALIIAKNSGMDVFNALNQMENSKYFKELKFGQGDGNLHYYLFNWKCPTVEPEKVGIVLQ